jgi:hypothetical protein
MFNFIAIYIYSIDMHNFYLNMRFFDLVHIDNNK